jgi:septal ring factor EnvC (AmiA/AmiB activator)
MATTSPTPDAPPDGAPKPHRNKWIWVSAALGVVAVGLLVWALSVRSDLGDTQDQLASNEQALKSAQQDLSTTEQQLDEATKPTPTPTSTPTPTAVPEEGNAGLIAAGALVTKLARDLGATKDELGDTEQELADAQKEADAAQQDADTAKQKADDASDDADQAKAEAEQANAERDVAQANAKIAAECGKAYVSAFAELFGSGSVREQVPAVRETLSGITAECKAAFAG